MRLVCPNCDAEYEVDDSLIPLEGRDVQCSNCTTTWFQAGPEAGESAVPTPADEVAEVPPEDPDLATIAAAAAAAATPTIRKPTVDQAALDVIHEEVERETSTRKAELGGIEIQPDLGLDDGETEVRASAARDRMARRRGLDPQAATIEDNDEALAAAPKRDEGHAKKELFPDIEEINSTLSPEAAEAEAEAARLAAEGGELAPSRSSGFRLGFGLMLLLAVGLLVLYVYAPQLAQKSPSWSGALSSYVSTVDSMRVWLDTAAQGLVEKIGVTLSDQS
ncbi:zinc-ribbon domain-containing protein [Litoreibacter janthinus]|uniref:MJ0042 family finger-like domain-containing protein n=1 Tax=Litoreibacter janthinus TaxID=670154 RepID=A0A1I6FQ80_9RHOB|nr:zinc-ribbon domain-containing protein [Litoreibacter janthinus]SFR32099.1 MJ0042 family finger-like domain-containing protein [Litoreibacter janthinus]